MAGESKKKTIDVVNDASARKACSVKGSHKVSGVRGLYLRVQSVQAVKADQSGAWAIRLAIHGKMRWLGLGRYPDVSLASARQEAQIIRSELASGIDPTQSRRKKEVVTWAVACERAYQLNLPKWTNEKAAAQFLSTLRTYTFPVIGDQPVEKVGAEHIAEVIRPIWGIKHETASRTLQRCGVVLRWALAHGHYASADSTDKILERTRALLGPVSSEAKKAVNHRALPFKYAPRIVEALNETGANPSTRLCFQFSVLTASRSSEARLAVWSEIDFEAKVWVIPANRYKTRKEHRVPLSSNALATLMEAREYSDGSNLVFCGSRQGKPISDATIRKALNAIPMVQAAMAKHEAPVIAKDGTSQPAKLTHHGIRSNFKDWAIANNLPRELVEMSLGHSIGGAVETAYTRDSHLEERRKIMEAWAQFLATEQCDNKIVPIRKATA